MDVIRRAREAWAITADDWFEGLVEASVVCVGGREALASSRDAVAQPIEVDR